MSAVGWFHGRPNAEKQECKSQNVGRKAVKLSMNLAAFQ
jgi:hypothetical protein